MSAMTYDHVAHLLEVLFAVTLLLATATPATAQLSATIKYSDRCWPYSSTVNRTDLLERQRINQKDMYRTSTSFWCVSSSLFGTVMDIINGSDFLPGGTGLVVQVSWSGGVVGYHRMGLFGEWDLDTFSVKTTMFRTMTPSQVAATLRSEGFVLPTSTNFPATDWQSICAVGLTVWSGAVGQLVYHNTKYGVAVVEWISISYGKTNFTGTGLYRYNSDAYDVCFSGCSDFSLYSFLEMQAFSICRLVVPSPSLLQSASDSEFRVGQTFIILPPSFMGLKLTFGAPGRPYYIDDPQFENMTFVDISFERVCLLSGSTCPIWSTLKMSDVVALIPKGSSVQGGGFLGIWYADVVFPPGQVITQANSSAPYMVNNMGAKKSFDFCLGDADSTQPCPIAIPTAPPNTTYFFNYSNSTEAPTMNPSDEDCTFDLLRVFYISVVPASVLCMLYVIFRKPDEPFRLTMTPNIMIPVNLLNFRIDRTLVAVTYGATFQIVFLLIFGELSLGIKTDNASGAKFVAFAAQLLLTVVIGFSFYIIFLGITTIHQPEGVIMGFVFSVGFVVFYILRIVSCKITSKVILAFQALPAFICLVTLAVYFAMRIIRYIAAVTNRERMTNVVAKYQFGKSTSRELPYLRSLLKRNLTPVKAEQESLAAEAKKGYIKNRFPRVWEWLHNNFPIPNRSDTFSYSPVFLSSVILGVTGMYMLIVSLVPALIQVAEAAEAGARNLTSLSESQTVKLIDGLLFAKDSPISDAINFVTQFLNLFAASALVAMVIAVIGVGLHCLHMVRTYKRHMLRLYRGDWSFLPRVTPKPLPQVKQFGKFLGTQTAYIIYGFIIMFFVTLLVLLIIGTFIICFQHFKWVRNSVYNVLFPTIVIIGIVWLIMHSMALFAIDKEESVRFAVLKRPIFYHNVVYLLAYYNVFLGIVSVLLRMLYIAAFNVVMLLRLNRPLMPRGWEKWDFGYFAYCGFLSMEFSHTHPCMLAFVALLQDMMRQPHRFNRAARRWHLAYTLVRNSHLVMLRQRNLTAGATDLKNHGLLMSMRASSSSVSSFNDTRALLTSASFSINSPRFPEELEESKHTFNEYGEESTQA